MVDCVCPSVHEKSNMHAYSLKKPIGKLNLERALDEDTGVFSFFFSSISSSPLGQTAISGNSTLHHAVILGVSACSVHCSCINVVTHVRFKQVCTQN